MVFEVGLVLLLVAFDGLFVETLVQSGVLGVHKDLFVAELEAILGFLVKHDIQLNTTG